MLPSCLQHDTMCFLQQKPKQNLHLRSTKVKGKLITTVWQGNAMWAEHKNKTRPEAGRYWATSLPGLGKGKSSDTFTIQQARQPTSVWHKSSMRRLGEAQRWALCTRTPLSTDKGTQGKEDHPSQDYGAPGSPAPIPAEGVASSAAPVSHVSCESSPRKAAVLSQAWGTEWLSLTTCQLSWTAVSLSWFLHFKMMIIIFPAF